MAEFNYLRLFTKPSQLNDEGYTRHKKVVKVHLDYELGAKGLIFWTENTYYPNLTEEIAKRNNSEDYLIRTKRMLK